MKDEAEVRLITNKLHRSTQRSIEILARDSPKFVQM